MAKRVTRSASKATDGPLPRIPLLGGASFASPTSEIDRRSEVYRRNARALTEDEKAKEKREQANKRRKSILTIPNLLTILRLVLVPVFVVLFNSPHKLSAPLAGIVFVTASITDWLDGYLARRLKLVSAFGAFLDPVADKVMVSTALILMAIGPPHPISHPDMALPVMLIIGREICMSALREWAASSGTEAHKAVKVNSFGKWKTAAQMVAMSVLLLARRADEWLPGTGVGSVLSAATGLAELEAVVALVKASMLFLWVAAALAVWSFGVYLMNAWEHFFTGE